jgi:hypothetical protein
VITVVAKLSVVDSTTSEMRIVIATRPVTDLPLNGRNFTQLLALTPGVSPISVRAELSGRQRLGRPGLVKVALNRSYTFIVLGLLILQCCVMANDLLVFSVTGSSNRGMKGSKHV